MIAIDTEVSGLDHYHGARVYYVTTCDEYGDQVSWEWAVDPLTRQPDVSPEDLSELCALIDDHDEYVFHNAKFDLAALSFIHSTLVANWPWGKTFDTVLAAHLLASNQPKKLTDLAVQWLGVDIQPYEDAVEDATNWCRRKVQQARLKGKRKGVADEIGEWQIAEQGRDDMPSAKEKCWKYDMWLPRAFADRRPDIAAEYPAGGAERLRTVLADYANPDSAVTIELWKALRAEVERRGLWDIYAERLKLLPIAFEMERKGVTVNLAELRKLQSEYVRQSRESEAECVGIAADLGYELKVPKSGSSKSLLTFCFGDGGETIPDRATLQLPPVKETPSGAASLDKYAIDEYEVTLPDGSAGSGFIKALKRKRKRDTSLGYLASYEKFCLPLNVEGPSDNGHVLLTPQTCGCRKDLDQENCPVCDWGLGVCSLCGRGEIDLLDPCPKNEWAVLHPSMNLTGTDTLRWSCQNPNTQQASKQETECQRCRGEGCDRCGGTGEDLHSLRAVFGPAPGREWWSFDAKNIELRIPAYESGEAELIALFERPDDPPYYGSNHLLNFYTVYPDIWAKELGRACGSDKCCGVEVIVDERLIGPHCKKKYASTWYQWCKNGGFAIQYGCQQAKADSTFHKVGAYKLLKQKFAKLERLNQACITQAEKHGYVTTIPDRIVSPKQGYPLLCTRTEWGKILPTVPLNYHVQSTAMWLMGRMMVKVSDQLCEWSGQGFAGYAILQIHDELVLDWPKRAHPKKDPKRSNLWRAKKIQQLMGSVGFDLVTPMPLPVGIEYHEISWAKGVSV